MRDLPSISLALIVLMALACSPEPAPPYPTYTPHPTYTLYPTYTPKPTAANLTQTDTPAPTLEYIAGANGLRLLEWQAEDKDGHLAIVGVIENQFKGTWNCVGHIKLYFHFWDEDGYFVGERIISIDNLIPGKAKMKFKEFTGWMSDRYHRLEFVKFEVPKC